MATQWNGAEATAQADSTRSRFDLLICNGDALTARTTVFCPAFQSACAKKNCWSRRFRLRALFLFLGVRGRDARLAHHNIFFSDDYPREFSEIHDGKISPREPTIYISISARSDPDHAPADHDNYFVLINAPARDPASPWTEARNARIPRPDPASRSTRFGLDLSGRIISERAFTPTDFASRDLAYHGALYGWASHSMRASLFRPPLREPEHGMFSSSAERRIPAAAFRWCC